MQSCQGRETLPPQTVWTEDEQEEQSYTSLLAVFD